MDGRIFAHHLTKNLRCVTARTNDGLWLYWQYVCLLYAIYSRYSRSSKMCRIWSLDFYIFIPTHKHVWLCLGSPLLCNLWLACVANSALRTLKNNSTKNQLAQSGAGERRWGDEMWMFKIDLKYVLNNYEAFAILLLRRKSHEWVKPNE